jgi:hypothetical protein|tara:strand:- start:182 stop:616 length:435 start_codon:yes stop_codon:yes gene_type:complete
MATKLVSPTTTASISISSGNITSNPLSISCTFQLKKAGTRTEGLDNFTGVSRRSHGSTTKLRVIDEADFGDDLNHVLYIKNLSTTAGEYLEIFVKDGNTPTDADNLLGRVYEGTAFLIPYAGHLDVFVAQSASAMEYEIALFSE